MSNQYGRNPDRSQRNEFDDRSRSQGQSGREESGGGYDNEDEWPRSAAPGNERDRSEHRPGSSYENSERADRHGPYGDGNQTQRGGERWNPSGGGPGRGERHLGQSSPYVQGQGNQGQGSSGYGQRSSGYGPSSSRYGQSSSSGQGSHLSSESGWRSESGRGGGQYGSGGAYGISSSRYGVVGGQSQQLSSERAGFSGRGPKGYTRTNDRIREDVCDRLSQDDEVDASEISVRVESGEVTLEGSIETRRQKHRAEEVAADVSGVKEVHNNVRVTKGVFTELKEKLSGDEEPKGGHAGSGTKTTSPAS